MPEFLRFLSFENRYPLENILVGGGCYSACHLFPVPFWECGGVGIGNRYQV